MLGKMLSVFLEVRPISAFCRGKIGRLLQSRRVLRSIPCHLRSRIQLIQVLLEANGLAAGKDHQFKGRYDAEKNAVIISLEKDEQSALSPQKCTT